MTLPRPDSAEMLSLAERKALRWYRAHGPAEASAPGAPHYPIRLHLIRRGWVGISPARRRFDPIKYDITPEGRKVIENCQ
jgi:hypothetical protein